LTYPWLISSRRVGFPSPPQYSIYRMRRRSPDRPKFWDNQHVTPFQYSPHFIPPLLFFRQVVPNFLTPDRPISLERLLSLSKPRLRLLVLALYFPHSSAGFSSFLSLPMTTERWAPGSDDRRSSLSTSLMRSVAFQFSLKFAISFLLSGSSLLFFLRGRNPSFSPLGSPSRIPRVAFPFARRFAYPL